MVEKMDRNRPRAGFSEAVPDFGTTKIDVTGLRPQVGASSTVEGSLRSTKVINSIEEAASKMPHIKDILSGKRKAAMILGAGAITFIVGYEGIVRHADDFKAIRKALKRRWGKDSS